MALTIMYNFSIHQYLEAVYCRLSTVTHTSPIARRRLDVRFDAVRSLLDEPRPSRGWIRALREALGMSTSELAQRIGVAQSRVSAIERAEAQGTLKLDTLERAAHALDCQLVYFLVPRTTLEKSVSEQARRKAAAILGPVAHSMRLEDQAVDSTGQLEDLAADLIDRRGLWADPPA